jgi:hypothetical protein
VIIKIQSIIKYTIYRKHKIQSRMRAVDVEEGRIGKDERGGGLGTLESWTRVPMNMNSVFEWG